MTGRFPESVDVAVVGSGPCGAAYIRVLSERRPDLRLATFEVGPLLADPPGLHVKNIADPAAREHAQRRSQGPGTAAADGRLARPGTYLLESGHTEPGGDGLPNAAMSSNVGGMGAHWTAACPRPGDSERIDFLPGLDELLDEAERLLGVDAHAFDDAPFAAEVRKRLADALDTDRPPERRVRPMPLAVHRAPDGAVTWSGSDVVYGDVSRANARHTLFPEALVTRVLVENGRATGVRVKDMRTGTEHTVLAAHVVVAADALRTPQLLWASGIRPAALGRCLNDQPQLVYAVRLRDVTASDGDSDGVGLARHSGVSWVPYTDAEPFHGQVMQLDASPVPLADDDVPAPGSIVGLGWFCAKDVRAEDRVEFDADRVDGYGMPAMRIHYSLTARDHATLTAARAAVRRAAHALGDPLDPEPRLLALGASLHYQGTVRMGPTDDGTSVCAPTGEVWGVRALHVAGNGVIPTPTACNPTLTSVALAVAGARHVADSTRQEGK
ncbi:GMC oxidoreductase [Streptomyces sp. NPDC006422]|uniref:GMC oxidoreductase n=1 Tax=unclassified Streptomyces TaxID=2593676 RepID=UPI0033AC4BB8